MEERKEILLGNGWHTLYSDEPWYLIVPAGSKEVVLEARFESDAPERSSRPNWIQTEFCVSKSDHEAVFRVSYAEAAELLAAARLSYVPEHIWTKATEECRKMTSA